VVKIKKYDEEIDKMKEELDKFREFKDEDEHKTVSIFVLLLENQRAR
jgi:hypothetical protein